MFHIYSKKTLFTRRVVAGFVTAMFLLTSLPPTAFAQEATTTPETTEVAGCTDSEALNFSAEATLDDGSCEYPAEETEEETTEETDTATSTEETGAEEGGGQDGNDGPGGDVGAGGGGSGGTATSTDDGTATSTEDGTSDENSEGGEETGDETATSTEDGTATSTDDGTATSTDNGTGEEGSGGDSGADGEGTETEPEEEENTDPIPVVSETDIGEDSTPNDGEGITGKVRETDSNVGIDTGDATAQGEVQNDVNSNLVRSGVQDIGPRDLDTYTFNATGTNDAVVTTDGLALAVTGENFARSRGLGGNLGGVSSIETGHSVAAINIANVVNSNVINSDGFLYLKNQTTEPGHSLNLNDFFFPDGYNTEGLSGECTLLSCRAEDVVYNFTQTNTATITNDVVVESLSGDNEAQGDYLQISTGDARGGANVINVVNTNIVDSNYRLLTYNALGDLDGDIILPTEDLLHAFFSRPNGLNQSEAEGRDLTVDGANEAVVNNDVNTYAESGLNILNTSSDSSITTGKAESESNILNKLNENVFGGDSMFLQIRVHGEWSGDVTGLPAGLTWNWAYDGNGIVIYIFNEDAEIAPSPRLPYDIDSYRAHVVDHNNLVLDNNINIEANSGENKIQGIVGNIETGDAIASANVMNVANTNIIGANWTYATVNIFGDFDGNITFSATDIALDGNSSNASDPVIPGSQINYSYTVSNDSDMTATGVTLRQTLQNGYTSGTSNQQEVTVGDLAPGETRVVNLSATPRSDLASGTFSVIATAIVESAESDGDGANNVSVITTSVIDCTVDGASDAIAECAHGGDDGGVLGDSGGSGDTGGSTSSGGGGGGGGSHKKKDVDRDQEIDIDPDSAPHLVIEKSADVDDDIVTAGEEVDYTIVLTNKGGQAYDVVVYDVLENSIGSVLSEQSWDLGTVLAGEVIKLTYTTEYDFKTPSGEYINTASVEGYRHEDSKEDGDDPLTLDDAKHTVEVKGVPLAVGNVKVMAVFPGTNGNVSALISWETSKAAHSQIFYGKKMPWNVFNENLPRYGYTHESFKFSKPKERHLMIIKDLKPGTEYVYRFDAENDEHDHISREYFFATPETVNGLALNIGQTFMAVTDLLARAKGIPVPAPAPYAAAQTPTPYVPPTPKPTPVPTPVVEPEPTPAPSGGSLFGTVKSFFGF